MIRLDDLPKRPPADAPEGYFEALPDRVLARVAPPQAARTVPLWQRWALPAGLAAALAGVWLYVGSPQQTPAPAPAGVLADFTRQELIHYLSQENLNPGDLPYASENSPLTDSLSNPVRWIQPSRSEVQELLANEPLDELI